MRWTWDSSARRSAWYADAFGCEHIQQGIRSSDRFSNDDLRKARAILGVEDGAEEVAVKRAYRLRALKAHPDKVPLHNQRWAHEEMTRLNWASQYLLKHG